MIQFLYYVINMLRSLDRSKRTKTAVISVLVFVWLFVLMMSLALVMLFLSHVASRRNRESTSLDTFLLESDTIPLVIRALLVTVFFILPLTILLVLYGIVGKYIRSSNSYITSLMGQVTPNHGKSDGTEHIVCQNIINYLRLL